jgi:glycosyltransferase involved in cell wall biosynthesis
MSRPNISVIISTYNSEEFLRGRLENLIEQTIFDKIEIIIVNSGSEQNEESIVNEYLQKCSNIKYLKTEKRETIYKAWNRGIKLAEGRYITNANADDRLRNDALEILSEALNKNTETALVYAEQYISDIQNPTFMDIDKKNKFIRLEYSKLRLLFGYIAGPQSMWRSSIHFVDNIWFNEDLEIAGDYEFVCRISEKYHLLKVPGVLGIYYKSKNNLNKEHIDFELTKKETYFIQDKYLRRYINSLDKQELNKLKRKIYFWVSQTNIFTTLFRKFLEISFPTYQIPPKIFYHWVGSVLAEESGNLEEAKDFCSHFINGSTYINLNMQIERIK